MGASSSFSSIHASGAPILDLDPFADDFLADPYVYHDVLREHPVFYLSVYGIFGMARFREVDGALRDHGVFCSGRGVGLSDFAKERPWRPPSLLLEVDPPLHDRTRAIVHAVLSPRALRERRADWGMKAESLVQSLAERCEFDAVKDLAEVYPLSVFPDAVGVVRDGRENLLPYGAMAFNAFGPRNALTEASMAKAGPVMAWVADACKRANLAPGGFGAQIFDAVDRGEATEEEGERLVRSFLTAGVDTTVNGLGNLMHAFAVHPEGWRRVREDATAARHCFEEALRWDSTVRTFFRTTTREVEVEGVRIPEGEKVLLFLAAANRDPRQWPEPEEFDVSRRAVGHVGFGAGIHNCVGQMIARVEAELVVAAMTKRFATIDAAGKPVRRLNNTLHALESLPVRITEGSRRR